MIQFLLLSQSSLLPHSSLYPILVLRIHKTPPLRKESGRGEGQFTAHYNLNITVLSAIKHKLWELREETTSGLFYWQRLMKMVNIWVRLLRICKIFDRKRENNNLSFEVLQKHWNMKEETPQTIKNRNAVCHTIQKCHYWVCIQRKWNQYVYVTWAHPCLLQRYSQSSKNGNNPSCWGVCIYRYRYHIYTRTLKYYSAIEKNKNPSLATKWMELEIIVLSEIGQTQKEKFSIISLIRRIKKKNGPYTSWE